MALIVWGIRTPATRAGGVVTMWTPNISTPVVKMLCHRGPVNALAFDPSGHYMVTAGGLGARSASSLHVQGVGSPRLCSQRRLCSHVGCGAQLLQVR